MCSKASRAIATRKAIATRSAAGARRDCPGLKAKSEGGRRKSKVNPLVGYPASRALLLPTSDFRLSTFDLFFNRPPHHQARQQRRCHSSQKNDGGCGVLCHEPAEGDSRADSAEQAG